MFPPKFNFALSWNRDLKAMQGVEDGEGGVEERKV